MKKNSRIQVFDEHFMLEKLKKPAYPPLKLDAHIASGLLLVVFGAFFEKPEPIAVASPLLDTMQRKTQENHKESKVRSRVEPVFECVTNSLGRWFFRLSVKIVFFIRTYNGHCDVLSAI
jgi:hypothetical protein